MYRYRYLCDVLDEMRSCFKTRNFAPILSLIEEAQTMGNRMEAGLETSKEYNTLVDDCKKLLIQRKKLQTEVNQLKKILDKPEDKEPSLEELYTRVR